ncbi:phosphotransferase family protein [Rhodoligotrophos defluvii]|uniref:phosphotransferase family protein n=1 Tax=Rhodoligotrophos defluvii TaxID=2561934 RepID=UPI0010C99440|nr:phosphotransferase family protein [Rhodoligotrophos defluvii]
MPESALHHPGEQPAPVQFDPFDLEGLGWRLRSFLRTAIGSDVELSPLHRYTVGFSWVTYGFSAKWHENGSAISRDLILRVGPPNGLFGPYKASPEALTLQALAKSAVPVPGLYWYSDESNVFGAPFFICDRVEGEAPIPWTADGGPAFDEQSRARLGEQFVTALAALHNFDWRGTPAAHIGGATDTSRTAAAQIDYWEGLMRQWSQRRYPILEWAVLWFREHAPAAPRISIVHGDYRIGNFLEREGSITAILDWELVHLGDPMEDLGWICLQAWRGRAPYMCHLLTREELHQRYSALTGLPVDPAAVAYWEAFGTFKLAVMHLGATYCYETRGFNDLRMAAMGIQIPRMLLQVESAVERAS